MTTGSYVEIWNDVCSNKYGSNKYEGVNFIKQVVAKFMILAFLIGKFQSGLGDVFPHPERRFRSHILRLLPVIQRF